MPPQSIASLAHRRDFNRRHPGRGSASGDSAAAALSLLARKVSKTDRSGPRVGEVTIPLRDFKLPACRARRLARGLRRWCR